MNRYLGSLKQALRSVKTQRLPAFSLIEVSIVLIIIGVLLTLVLANTNLIGNARLKSVIVDVQRYRAATQQFQDIYHALPGSYSHAEATFPGAQNGAGGTKVTGGGLAKGSDAVKFWDHLMRAKLISGIGTEPESGPTWGKGVPSAAVGGGFTVISDPAGLPTGLWLVLGEKNGDAGTAALLTPRQAQEIDAKLDNGNPGEGWIRAQKGDHAAGDCSADGHYKLDNPSAACTLYFQLN